MCGSPFPREVVALAIVEVHLCLLSPKAEDCRLVDSAEAVVALAFFSSVTSIRVLAGIVPTTLRQA
jgi:hypothetical protein